MNASWDSTSWSKPCEPKRRLTFIGQHIIILQVLVNIGTPKAHESLLWEHSKYAHFNFLSNLTTYSPLKKFLCVACGCGNIEGFVSLRVHVEFVGMWRNINIYISITPTTDSASCSPKLIFAGNSPLPCRCIIGKYVGEWRGRLENPSRLALRWIHT